MFVMIFSVTAGWCRVVAARDWSRLTGGPTTNTCLHLPAEGGRRETPVSTETDGVRGGQDRTRRNY